VLRHNTAVLDASHHPDFAISIGTGIEGKGDSGDVGLERPNPFNGLPCSGAPSPRSAPGHRLVEHLGERELGLQDGELIAITGGAIACRKRMRMTPALGYAFVPSGKFCREIFDKMQGGPRPIHS
jgi:hypothetical protein